MVDYEVSDHALEALVAYALEGLEGLRPFAPPQVLKRQRPVRLERTGEGLVVEVWVAVDYGQVIPELAEKAQRAVAEALYLATGERVKAVNLTVAQVQDPRGGHAQAG
ncbi:hypothetical protein GCM10007092_13050 [Thermus composti]|uniref:Asp23/Gls24 family envelope stress response protein n=1 Tax=Thermus composti TaxID=532059 RepID=A0ABV6Q2U0_9DEIN|nr:Asp23/Gls24 family envelope stress response protein [Thermus composti]GGN00414.1 hypothetical protein GCM10007092_13050 [Thermus composti]